MGMMVSTSMNSTSGSTKVIDSKKRGTTNESLDGNSPSLSIEEIVVIIVISIINNHLRNV